MTRRERLHLAHQIEAAADEHGTVQAESMVRLAPARPEWHTAMQMQRVADLLGVRAELDEVCS